MCTLRLYPPVVLQRPTKVHPSQLTQFHSPQYVNFLSRVRPDNVPEYAAEMREHNFNDDCPVFDGLFDFCR
jgi:histone deacetylase 1/2